MGIRGLTTYISQNSKTFHEPYTLHDCPLVIDGSSIASKLYADVCKCNSLFGGDYEEYTSTVINFFSLLLKCNIIPLVVIDGGYERRKLKTAENRLKAKLQAAQLYRNFTQSHVIVFPLLLRDAFKQALKLVGVKFVQVDFEADNEVAALARLLKCSVLSQDSDFYVYDVPYIPFSTLNCHVCKGKNQNGSVKKFLRCEVFQTDRFLKHFGGLDKALLPLMATLLGNDYVSVSIFEKFYSHVKLPNSKKMSMQQKRISAIFQWLRGESLESALLKILGHFKKEIRKKIMSEIRRSLSGYNHSRSVLLPEFDFSSEEISRICSNSLEDGKNPITLADDSGSSQNEDNKSSFSDHLQALNAPKDDLIDDVTILPVWPKWMIDMFRKGNLPSFVSDIYYLQIFFCQPQVEDFSREDSHCLSLPILKISYSLLISSAFQTSMMSQCSKKFFLTCLTRGSGTTVHKYELEPVIGFPWLSPFPALSILPTVHVDTRKKMLLSALQIENEKDVEILMMFPDKWILFAMVVVYWGKTSICPRVNCYLLNAVILTWIILGVVDCSSEINEKSCKLYTDGEVSVNTGHKSIPDSNHEIFRDIVTESLKDNLAQVTLHDCKLLVESLSDFRSVQQSNVQGHKHMLISVAHSFAQLQACMQQAMALNAILCFPCSQIKIKSTYSGSVAFSAYSNLNKLSDVESFIKSLLKKSNAVMKVYESLLFTFKLLLPDLHVPQRKAKKRSKQWQELPSTSISEDMLEVNENESEDETTMPLDKNNKYSILSVL